jgi:formylglycine-generating enzyme required for sulfatase activity
MNQKFLILSLLLIFETARSEDLANGIVIYKTNPSSSDEFAITIEFSKIEVHPRAVNGVKADGSPINLPSTNVVAYFNYPDLKSGTISSTTQVAEFMELGKRMVDAAGKYPTAAKAMGARLEEMKTAAVKFNQGWFLAGGEWKQPMSQEKGKASQTITADLKILKTKAGQSYSFRAVKQYSSNQVTIEHTGGITKVDLGNLTEESLALLNQDADFKRLKKVDEDSAAMTGQRTGELRTFGGIEMVWCPPGEFLMGSPEDEEGRSEYIETQHRVSLTKGFWLAKTECTQGQWESVMGDNPSTFKGMDLPVEQVSWDDVQKYLIKMNTRYALPSGWKWSLPTEAQWEYACRAGTVTAFAGDLDEMAWYAKNSGTKTNPVGTKKANDWGLYDMHGNLAEWCADWYGGYKTGSATDPTGTADGSFRVWRGGAHSGGAAVCRSAARGRISPGFRAHIIGFRPAAVSAGR